MKRKLIIGSRGSDLALWQANYIQDKLKKLGAISEINVIKTQGDKIQDLSFDKMEGKGFFTKEIEESLLAQEIDLAIHSYKDLETTQPEELQIAAVSVREDPSDLLLINKSAYDVKRKLCLKDSAIVGTSSARRKSQMLGFRSDICLKDLRGNVPTRIQKLRDGGYDAILLASAGVNRLEIDLSDFHVEILDPTEFIPAPAQGVLACQIRKEDEDLAKLLNDINEEKVADSVHVEREVLSLFEGGCQMPVGVYCECDEDDDENAIYKVWVAKSDHSNIPPILSYTESKNRNTLAEKVVNVYKDIKPGKVFITRELRKDDHFANVLNGNKYSVSGKSLIKIQLVDFKARLQETNFGWVFFSSKQAVKYFFMQNPDCKEVKYGAIGKSTAAALRRFGKSADFIGYSTDTKMTGKQFASSVGNERVLFPQAKGSMRTIQQQFYNKKQVVDLIVYDTLVLEDFAIPVFDTILFTSPSNVRAYMKHNVLNTDKKVVAMGDATGNELKKFGVNVFNKPSSFSDAGLAQAVFSS